MYDYWSDDQRANKWVLILKNKNKQIAKKPVICCNKNKLKKKNTQWKYLYNHTIYRNKHNNDLHDHVYDDNED